jgi:hypothetical protein
VKHNGTLLIKVLFFIYALNAWFCVIVLVTDQAGIWNWNTLVILFLKMLKWIVIYQCPRNKCKWHSSVWWFWWWLDVYK